MSTDIQKAINSKVSNFFLTYKTHFTIVHNSFKNDSDGDGYVRSY